MRRHILSILLLSVLLSASASAGQDSVPCWMLDDPEMRGQMSFAMEMRMFALCNRWVDVEIQQMLSPLCELSADGSKAIPNGPDVLVNDPSADGTDSEKTQSECAVAVNADGELAAGWNDSWHYYHGSTTSFAGYGYSTDGGASWTDGGPISGGSLGTPLGDPDINTDSSGNFWYTCMYSSGLMAAKSTDGGASFGSQVSVHTSWGDDKVLAAIDATGGAYDGYIYVCWKDFWQSDFNLYCARSTNGGISFGSPVNICTTCGSEQSQAPFPAVAPNGDVYVAWEYYNAWPPSQARIKVSKSTNGGASFVNLTDPTPLFSPSKNTSATSYCGRPALKGPFRYSDFPSMAISPDGTVHIAYSQHGASTDEADVMYVKSENGGTSWSTPVKLNDDSTTRDQFFPTIVSNPNGILIAYWYDRRDDPSNVNFKIYKSRSLDGGDTWTPNEAVSDVASGIYSGGDTAWCYMGDYNKGAADEDYFYIIWSDNRHVSKAALDPNVWFEAQPVCDNEDVEVNIEPEGGMFPPSQQPVEVTVSFAGDDPYCPQPGDVYYTLDGTDPTTDSDEYTAPVQLTDSAVFKILPFTCCGQQLPTQQEEYILCKNDDPNYCGEDCEACAEGEDCVEGECVSADDDDTDDDDDSGDDNGGGGCGC